jgi:hypothetical protein
LSAYIKTWPVIFTQSGRSLIIEEYLGIIVMKRRRVRTAVAAIDRDTVRMYPCPRIR